MSHSVGKVLVAGMDGLRHDLLTRSPATAPVLHALPAAGAHEADDSTGHNEPRPAAPPPGERSRP
ncbi:hypothetical protein ACFYZ2_05955 [Streptomyces sviceus]|uniref:hypothetical protein n=1 Tax=Streptomyces sviceus TaxID=285530 RepID=UPI0036A6F144